MELGRKEKSDIYFQIKEAACELFQSKGFDNTAVNDLLEKLQIEEQVLYSYFQSLDDVLEVVWSES